MVDSVPPPPPLPEETLLAAEQQIVESVPVIETEPAPSAGRQMLVPLAACLLLLIAGLFLLFNGGDSEVASQAVVSPTSSTVAVDSTTTPSEAVEAVPSTVPPETTIAPSTIAVPEATTPSSAVESELPAPVPVEPLPAPTETPTTASQPPTTLQPPETTTTTIATTTTVAASPVGGVELTCPLETSCGPHIVSTEIDLESNIFIEVTYSGSGPVDTVINETGYTFEPGQTVIAEWEEGAFSVFLKNTPPGDMQFSVAWDGSILPPSTPSPPTETDRVIELLNEAGTIDSLQFAIRLSAPSTGSPVSVTDETGNTVSLGESLCDAARSTLADPGATVDFDVVVDSPDFAAENYQNPAEMNSLYGRSLTAVHCPDIAEAAAEAVNFILIR